MRSIELRVQRLSLDPPMGALVRVRGECGVGRRAVAAGGSVRGVVKQVSCDRGCQRWWGDAARRTADAGSAGQRLQGADGVERGCERGSPGPPGREPECWSAGAVDEPSGECEEPGADGAATTNWSSTRALPIMVVQR